MPFRRLRAKPRPFDKEEVSTPSSRGLARLFRHDLHAVREPVASLERGRPVVDSHVAADRRLIALGVIGRPVPRMGTTHHRFLRPTISRMTFPVMKATFAGRSARRRMRYGYHCVPNGTYTRMRYPSRTSCIWRSRRTP